MGCKPNWKAEEINYLEENWGKLSIATIAKNLNRSKSGILNKAGRLKLGPYLDSGDYIKLNQLMSAMRNTFSNTGRSYTVKQWMDKGLPVKAKKVRSCSFKIVYIDDWWDWAEVNRTLIDFSKLAPNTLGKEPEWVEQQRRADLQHSIKYKKTPWAKEEDELLRRLLNSYRYSYREISLRLQRTEGAVKRRCIDLDIKARPIKADNHNPWTNPEVNKLKELYYQGHNCNTMADYIQRSAHAISGKIERMIKVNELYPRSEYRTSR